ncbi:hypothetical protein [Phenylobacterium sp.]|uniref:hypothetical protein n=1 Tax=Phenylobacterium sp. TaxID=1871053 RepID=UPI0012217BCE|nr:hypothetical protein [Phenylobacterium sp.]THD63573.1 MAG: hypothetical protein E8A49_05365 [Phenylobacterium sp.]
MALLDFINAHPWIWGFLAIAFAVWGGAVWTLLKSPKFLRKGLWFLLSCVSFRYGWGMADGTSFSIGFPVGALYILGFARFGPAPNPAAVAAHHAAVAARRAYSQAPVPRVLALHIAYAAAAVTAVAAAAWFTFGPPDAVFGDLARATNDFELMRVLSFPVMMVLALLFAFLAARPQPWGKILCAAVAVAWLGNGLGNAAFKGAGLPAMGSPAPALAGGAVMLCVAILQQVLDPRPSPFNLRRFFAMPAVKYDDPTLDEGESRR